MHVFAPCVLGFSRGFLLCNESLRWSLCLRFVYTHLYVGAVKQILAMFFDFPPFPLILLRNKQSKICGILLQCGVS